MNSKELAKERTEMADERTLLAYIRTGLSLFIFGIVIHKLYPESIYSGKIFVVSIIGGVLLLFWGIVRFFYFLRRIE